MNNPNNRLNQIKYNRLYLNQFKPEECLPPYIKDNDEIDRYYEAKFNIRERLFDKITQPFTKAPRGYYIGGMFLILAWVIFSVFGPTGC